MESLLLLLIHRHCIQQTFHIPLIQLNMPPDIINTAATFEKMNFVLMLRLQAHNFSLLYQETILANASKLDQASGSQFQPSLPENVH